jgi:hypothetical protein
MRKVLIHGNQYFKTCLLRSRDQFTVCETLKTCEAARLALVICELMTERLVDTLVQQETHSAAGEQSLFRFFESLQSHFPSDCRKSLQKSLEAMAGLQVFEECAHENSSASKRGFARHDFGISNDNRFHLFSVSQSGAGSIPPIKPFHQFAEASVGTQHVKSRFYHQKKQPRRPLLHSALERG